MIEAAVAEAGQVLGREEREGRGVAERAAAARRPAARRWPGPRPRAGPGRARRQTARSAGASARVAEQVDGAHGAGARRDGRVDGLGVEAEGRRLDVGEDGRAAGAGDGLGGGVEGEGGADDLVAPLDAERPQRDHQRVGAVGDPHAVGRADPARASASSASATRGPSTKRPDRTTSCMAAVTRSSRGATWGGGPSGERARRNLPVGDRFDPSSGFPASAADEPTCRRARRVQDGDVRPRGSRPPPAATPRSDVGVATRPRGGRRGRRAPGRRGQRPHLVRSQGVHGAAAPAADRGGRGRAPECRPRRRAAPSSSPGRIATWPWPSPRGTPGPDVDVQTTVLAPTRDGQRGPRGPSPAPGRARTVRAGLRGRVLRRHPARPGIGAGARGPHHGPGRRRRR